MLAKLILVCLACLSMTMRDPRNVTIQWQAKSEHITITRQKIPDDGNIWVVYDRATVPGETYAFVDFNGCACRYTINEQGQPTIVKQMTILFLPVAR